MVSLLEISPAAKINLDLRLLGGRPDGYLEIRTLYQSIDLPVVVAVPGVRVSTAEVYARMSRQLTSHRPEGTVYAFAADPRGWCDFWSMANEFENVVVDSWPEVGEGLRKLRSHAPLFASLSGSGAASFAVFDSQEAARRAAEALPATWFVHVGTTLRRSRARLEIDGNDGGRG
jgi:4-diphosphocytidyl-2-C-methyl-D-erythritol kinase